MEEIETQQILSVTSPGEPVEGDLQWKGNALYFTPLGGWKAGSRYTLALSGQVYAADGRELRLAEYIPFYAVARPPLPRVLSCSPPDGASAGVSLEAGLSLTLNFSEPMDRRSTEAGFTLEGVSDKEFCWEEDDRILRIVPRKSLSPWSVYRWSLEDALSREGAPLVESFSALFVTGADRVIPRVTELFPMIRSVPPDTGEGNAAVIPWVGTGAGLERGLGSGQGIGIRFNKPMDRDSLLRAVRIEPSLSGRAEVLTDTTMVFIPDRDGEGDTAYTLTVSADTRDRSGLTLGEDHIAFFTPDIPLLGITGISLNGILLPSGGGEALSCRIPMEDSYKGILEIALSFSLPFSREAAVEAALAISLDPWFPGLLTPVSLKAAAWSSSVLEMEWDGVVPGEIPEVHYYRLSVPGGKTGITNGLGSTMKESRIIYIEAAKP
jgi:hypothetical protein